MAADIFIVTAEMDPESQQRLGGLRRQHYPPDRNFVPAHLTLFHRAGPANVETVAHISLPKRPLPLTFSGLRHLGYGVAVEVIAPELKAFRQAIVETFGYVSKQDAQTWRPHVTIQNKVSGQAARTLYNQLAETYIAREGTATGLSVWEYRGGPWSLHETFEFK
jgi:2'-5' RNA ligase